MTLQEQLFKEIEKSIQPYKKIMAKASDSILDQEISSYPIFVVHKAEVALGLPLVENDRDININASSLEEFSTKSLIAKDKLEDFTNVYKDPKLQFCLFIINEKIGATFVFLPRD